MKTIAFLLTAGCGVLALVALSLTGQAQEQASPTSVAPLSPDDAAQLWQQAQETVAQGQPETGADLYMRIFEAAPMTLRSVNAALRAGHSYRAADLPDKATAAYDAVVAAATTYEWPADTDWKALNNLRGSAVCNKALILDKAGQHEQAAALYGSLVREIIERPKPLQNIAYDRAMATIERAGLAVECLERANKPAETIWYHDAIRAIAEAKGWERDQETSQTAYQIQNAGAQALCDKASACARAGLVEDALAAIHQMRTEFADCPAATHIAILQAQLTGGRVDQAELLGARESEACELLKQVNAAYNPSVAPDDTLERLDQIITGYPGTSAALRALEMRGRVLKRHERFEEAEVAFTTLMEQLGGEAAFRARLYQTARIQLAETQIKRLRARQLDKERVSPQEWDDLRLLLADIMDRGLRRVDRITAHFLLIETYAMEDLLDEMLQEADAFLTQNAHEDGIRTMGPLIMWVHNFMGVALHRQKRYDEALEHFRWVTQHYETTGTLPPNDGFMPLMYYRVWDVLRRADAPSEEIERAAEEIRVRFPYSEAARRLPIQAVPPGN